MNEQAQALVHEKILAEAGRLGLRGFLLSTPLVLGVSGGADSLAMLHIICALRGKDAPGTIHVAHLNHWFRKQEARDDAAFVRDTAEQNGLSCTIEVFDVPNYARRSKLSAEDAARRVRYAFLASLARERGAAVAVAHNADDQIETVLMSILRGTGIGGLAGMQMLGNVPPTSGDGATAHFTPGAGAGGGSVRLFRPLLHIWRHEILDYCKSANLEPRFDSTNWERVYKRNRVRHDLIPLLQMQYSLAIKSHLYNLAQIAQGENELLDIIVEGEWQRIAEVVNSNNSRKVTIEQSRFAPLHDAMKRRLARRAILEVAGALQDISFEQVNAVTGILAGEQGSPAAMHLPHHLVAARRGKWSTVGIRDDGTTPEASENRPTVHGIQSIRVEPGMNTSTSEGWVINARVMDKTDVSAVADTLTALFDYDVLATLGPCVLRTRREGDYIQPMGMQGRKSLQDLMVDAKIPRELRTEVAVIALENSSEVIWVPGKGGRRSRHAPVTSSTQRVLQINFSKQPNEL